MNVTERKSNKMSHVRKSKNKTKLLRVSCANTSINYGHLDPL